MNLWTGIDLDGTLAFSVSSDKWKGDIGTPLTPMIDRVKKWLKEGKDVRIVTARVGSCGAPDGHCLPEFAGPDNQRKLIEKWCLTHIGQVLPVTAEKDFYMERLYDDRAIQVQHNTGFLVNEDNR